MDDAMRHLPYEIDMLHYTFEQYWKVDSKEKNSEMR
jgi:hypothetical protein